MRNEEVFAKAGMAERAKVECRVEEQAMGNMLRWFGCKEYAREGVRKMHHTKVRQAMFSVRKDLSR